MTVTSGKCVPPLNGAFRTNTSPFFMSGFRRMTVRIDSDMEPRCTGTCGAFATSPPVGSNSAQLKSSLSLMFTE